MNVRRRRRDDPSPYGVVLGSGIDLHPGIHGSLRASPPSGYRYVARNAEHVFLHGRGRPGFSPLRRRHWAELVRFGAGTGLVHSVTWPVLGQRHWVVELDDFGYPAYAGRRLLSAGFRRSLEHAWTIPFTRDVRLRTECLVRAYTHQSCGAVIFMTFAAARAASSTLVQLQLERWIEPLMAKAVVIYPAAEALPAGAVALKWDGQRPLKVLFCGRAFRAKDGALALRVVRRLFARGYDFEFTYVGHIPTPERDRFRDVLARVRVFESLPRRRVLALMKDAHVLFHPSPSESVGMVLVEAAAAGLAVVASEGPGLPQLHELFPPGGVRSVDRGTRKPDRARARFRGGSRGAASIVGPDPNDWTPQPPLGSQRGHFRVAAQRGVRLGLRGHPSAPGHAASENRGSRRRTTLDLESHRRPAATEHDPGRLVEIDRVLLHRARRPPCGDAALMPRNVSRTTK